MFSTLQWSDQFIRFLFLKYRPGLRQRPGPMNRGHSLAVLRHPADLLRTLVCLDSARQPFSVYPASCLFAGQPPRPSLSLQPLSGRTSPQRLPNRKPDRQHTPVTQHWCLCSRPGDFSILAIGVEHQGSQSLRECELGLGFQVESELNVQWVFMFGSKSVRQMPCGSWGPR